VVDGPIAQNTEGDDGQPMIEGDNSLAHAMLAGFAVKKAAR
jgi:hypothetical protein